MLRKILSMLLVIVMLFSVSVTFVSADATTDVADTTKAIPDEVSTGDEVSTDDEISSFDEAYAQLLGVLELTKDINGNYYTDESYEIFETALADARFAFINIDMFTVDDIFVFANELESAYKALEALIFGDADGDKKVNIKDATEIQKYLASIVKLSEKRLLCADINRDGINNIKDATVLQKHLAGVISLSEIKYIELDFYIIDLKIQLLELMEYGKELTYGNKFEMESYYRYLTANRKAISAYRDKWPFKEDPYVVADALAQLKLAIEGLIPADEIPGVSTEDEIIDFTIEYEYRVGEYDHDWQAVNFIARSPEDIWAVLDKLDTQYYLNYTKEDIFPEKYDDAFFEENAVIISLLVIGGSGCNQRIHTLTVDGTALIIHRTITRPTMYPPDMNYPCTFIEVNKADIAGVDMVINDTDYIIIGGDNDA